MAGNWTGTRLGDPIIYGAIRCHLSDSIWTQEPAPGEVADSLARKSLRAAGAISMGFRFQEFPWLDQL